MKKILSILVLVLMFGLYSTSAFALIQAFRLGAVGQDSVAGTKYATSNIAGSSDWETLEYPVGTDYQVTAGYTLYVTKISWSAGSAGHQIAEIGYADNAVAEGTEALTNGKIIVAPLSGSADNVATITGLWKIPASKYLYMKTNVANGMVMIFGVEIAD